MRKTTKKIKQPKKIDAMQTAFTRFMMIVAFFVFWIGGIGARLVYLQINQHEEYRVKALNQRRDLIKEKQMRGTIFDRNQRALAMSINVKSLTANPSEIEDVEGTAKEISKILKIKPNDILKTLTEGKENNKKFVWLARKLDENTADELNKKLEQKNSDKSSLPKFKGLYWREEQKRSYPYQTLAAHVVGFSNTEDVGSAGIEQSQEEVLHGAVIKGWQDRDRLGRVYDESEVEREEPHDVVLTISHSIQYKTETALEKAVKSSNAKSGMAVVLDVKTGEVLAMANYPTFNPNKYTEFTPESYTNRAVHDIYSPGSVFKVVTYGAALQENLIKPEGEIECGNGVLKIPGREILDKHCHNRISYLEAMAVSSNIAAMKTGFSLGKDKFYDYAQKFGFGSPVGIELPAEANGIMRSPAKWQADSLASMSIGYEIGVTALQVATAYAIIANDGVRIQPHIIKEIRKADGKTVSATEAQKTQVVNAESALNLRKMMREVVLKGTGKRAQLNGYSSAGKTGTAWKYNAKLKKIDSGKYVSSFIGMAPAEKPAVVIAVVMDEPQGGARDGGQVSAPVFREIAEQILPELNVVPDLNLREDSLTAEQQQQQQQIPVESVDVPKDEEVKNSIIADEIDKSNKIDKKVVASKSVSVPKSLHTAKNAEANEKLKETKKEIKLSETDKKGVKPKTAASANEKPKNKSSGEAKNKT